MEISRSNLVVLTLSLFCISANALVCDSDELKITIKTEPGKYTLDLYEQYELRATVAYSVRKYCGGGNEAFENPAPAADCPDKNVGTDKVNITEVTGRISCCIEVTGFLPDVVRTAIKGSKANLNGALLLTDEVLLVDGIEPTLEPPFVPDFAYWLIAYIVIFSLILLAGVAMLLYSKFHKGEAEEEKELMVDDETGSIEHDVYEQVEEKVHENRAFQNDGVEEATAL